MATDDNGEAALDAELAAALADDEFFLLFQPTIDLETDAFVGVESLLRWASPSRGVVPPAAFVPQLEASGEIVEVGAWVLRSAAEHGAEWHARGHRFWVSVNVSPVQLASSAFAGQLEDILDASGFDPGHLVLEVPGSALRASVRALADARELGVRLCVDDFGADPGLFDLLAGSPVSVVKIDRSVVGDLSSDEGAERVRSLVELGHRLRLQTVAQGIEHDDQRLRLRREHVDVGQGFLLSRPHTADELDRLLEDYAIFSGRPL